ncbi:hypothetical protein Tco_1508651 [Tanacetum coccineum]
MAKGLSARMLIEHRDSQGQSMFREAILDLDTPGALQFQLGGARRHVSLRQFIFALGLHTGEEIEFLSFDRYWAKSRSQAPEKVLEGLTIIAPELLIIDMAELVMLQICMDIDDTWAWVAIGLERQPNAMVGTPGVAQDALAVNEGIQADPTPVQAPTPLPPAAGRTMPQRMARLDEDVHEIRGELTKQHEVIDVMAHDFSRFST